MQDLGEDMRRVQWRGESGWKRQRQTSQPQSSPVQPSRTEHFTATNNTVSGAELRSSEASFHLRPKQPVSPHNFSLFSQVSLPAFPHVNLCYFFSE
ncbi:hypothetical protein Pcinc_012709 [Petrolisthes cinctipes]|uniref:Uncharacterized protein n=1 Tax=Petrolisthes cinctipes TaxID=88211 RepID=A0AAE1FYC3_PETCI|nr:hypothetical protein Pcinc_012709 [Petrolisthes cinctipes]